MTSELNEMWRKLRNHLDGNLHRGSLIAFDASYPFEDKVVMMLCEAHGGGAISLVCITGYKAGFDPYVVFPSEASGSSDQKSCVSARWLYDNFDKWVFPGSDRDNVWVREAAIDANVFFDRDFNESSD